jgi:hypothetical protein
MIVGGGLAGICNAISRAPRESSESQWHGEQYILQQTQEIGRLGRCVAFASTALEESWHREEDATSIVVGFSGSFLCPSLLGGQHERSREATC